MKWFKSDAEGDDTYPSCRLTLAAAHDWYDKCFIQPKQFAEAMIIPGVHEGTTGCYMVRTTHDECHIQIERQDRARRPEGHPWRPAWLGMDVYWYPGTPLFNTSAIISMPLIRLGSLYQVLRAKFMIKGDTEWEMAYPGVGPHEHWRSTLFDAFDNPCIVEYTSTLSSECFRGLEVYMRVSTVHTDIDSTHVLTRPEAKYEVIDYQRVWLREDKNASVQSDRYTPTHILTQTQSA